MTDRAMTAGEALWLLGYEKNDLSPRKAFTVLTESSREYWEDRAQRILSDAAAIRERMGDVGLDAEAMKCALEMEIECAFGSATRAKGDVILRYLKRAAGWQLLPAPK